MYALLITLHVLAAFVWVGGMFFALVVLRPATLDYEPARRLQLWAGVLKRFFPWVWMAVTLLLISGYGMLFGVFGGFSSSPGYVHLMHVIGLLMMALFVYLYYVPYRVFKREVAAENWPDAGVALNRIRWVVLKNLVLGSLLIVVVYTLPRL